MYMSVKARINLRQREKKVMRFYDDGGKPGVGHCTYGYGTLAHRGPCTAEELKSMIYSTQKRNGKTVPILMRGLIPRREEESAPFRKPKLEASRSAAK